MKRNDGFSLIELIIVIAIMAILVGTLAPLLIHYYEKTKVSADTQLADTVRSAMLAAITDTKVADDPASQPFLDQLEAPGGLNIDSDGAFNSSNCILKESLEDIFGFPSTQLVTHVRSQHGGGCHFNVQVSNGTQVKVTITETDCFGKKDTSAGTPGNDIKVE